MTKYGLNGSNLCNGFLCVCVDKLHFGHEGTMVRNEVDSLELKVKLQVL